MDNLVLVPENCSYEHYEEPSNKFNREQSLYWIAVQHLLIDSLHQVHTVKILKIRTPEQFAVITLNSNKVALA